MENKKRICHYYFDTIFLDILFKSALTIISEKSGFNETDLNNLLQFKGHNALNFYFLKGVHK
jgi:hypothetical protein